MNTDKQRNPLDYASRRQQERGARYGCLTLVARFAGLLFLLVGIAWSYNFIFTDHRAHLRPIMIPMALIAMVLGGLLIALPTVLKRKR